MSIDAPIIRLPLRVRYHECDPQGVVFNANYLVYADMAGFECIETLFGSYRSMAEGGVDMVVAESNIRYLVSCRYGDQLSVDCFFQQIGNTSLTLRFAIGRAEELVAEIVNRYVFVDTETFRPAAPPEEVRAAFLRFARPAQ